MDGTLAKSLAEDFFKNGLQKCVDTRAHTHALWCDVVGWCVCTQTCICTLYIVHVQYITFFFRYSQSHLGRHFRKLKAQSSNVSFSTFQWKETFELWALKQHSKIWPRVGLAVHYSTLFFMYNTLHSLLLCITWFILHVQCITFFILHVQHITFFVIVGTQVHYIIYYSCTIYYIIYYCRHTGTFHYSFFMYNTLHSLLVCITLLILHVQYMTFFTIVCTQVHYSSCTIHYILYYCTLHDSFFMYSALHSSFFMYNTWHDLLL